jgi:DNA-binding SARP family transcriptional activator
VAIEYRVLGSLEALDGGHPLSLGGLRQRAVLAVLLLHANEVVPASRLIDDVWGDEPPETAANILQGYVSDLRHVLGRDAIVTRGRGYAISVEAGDLDLRRFERLAEAGTQALDHDRASEAAESLRQALGLWRGPALADLDESFALAALGRLEELRLGALDRRIYADLACGRHAEVVAELTALVAEHPLRERFRAQHMLALYRCGRQAEALDSYRAARTILAEELGIDPGPPLQRLEREILAHDPSLDPPKAGHDAFLERPAPPRVVLAVTVGGSPFEGLSYLGEGLVRLPGYELIVASLVRPHADLASETARMQEVRSALEGRGIAVRAAAFTSTSTGEDVVRLSSEQDVALTLLEAPSSLLRDGVPQPEMAAVLRDVPCDVALLVTKERSSGGPVVVPFGGADHDWAAVELGAWLARGWGVPLRLGGAGGGGGGCLGAWGGQTRHPTPESETPAGCCSTRPSRCNAPSGWLPNRSWPPPVPKGSWRRAPTPVCSSWACPTGGIGRGSERRGSRSRSRRGRQRCSFGEACARAGSHRTST